MRRWFARKPKRTIEEIRFRFIAPQSKSNSELWVMSIVGHADAVLKVAEQMKMADQIVEYGPYPENETYLVFRASALRDTEPLELFAPIQAAAWKIVKSGSRR